VSTTETETTPRRVAYFKGCLAALSAKELDTSTQALAPMVGLELVELEAVTCCGAGDIHEAEPDYYLHLNARILAYAEATGCDTLLTVCNVCTLNLRQANFILKGDTEVLARVNENLETVGVPPYSGAVEVRHLLWEIAEGEGYEKLKEVAHRGLKGLKVAPFYGCQILRPSKILGFEDPDRPWSLERIVEAWVADLGREAHVVETAEHRVVPVPRVRQMCEALRDDLAGLVGAVQPVLEHELERARLGVAERSLRHDSSSACDPQVLEHVERRVKRAVVRARVVAHPAVPAAVVELRRQHGLGQRRKPRVAVQEVRAESEPETEVAEIDPLEHERAVDVGTGRHEAIEQSLERRPRRRMILGYAARDEQEKRPRRGGPPSLRPTAVRALVCKKVGDPARFDHACPLGRPGLGGLVEQVAHRLPADDGVTREEPLDGGVVSAGQAGSAR